MANEDKRIWGIHAQDDNLFLKDSVIAIGWNAMGNLSQIEANREAFKEKYIQTYPDAKKVALLPEQVCCIASAMKRRLEIMWYSRLRVIAR